MRAHDTQAPLPEHVGVAVLLDPLPAELGTMKRRPSIGPSPPLSEADPPSAVVPQPVSTRPAATAPTVSFRREAVRIVSSCVRAGYRRVTAKVATGVVRVTLACAMGVVVVVVTVTGRRD